MGATVTAEPLPDPARSCEILPAGGRCRGVTSDVKNLDANGSASHPIHLHPPNRSWIST